VSRPSGDAVEYGGRVLRKENALTIARWSGRNDFVEMPGVEPGSGWAHLRTPTCVVDLLVFHPMRQADRHGRHRAETECFSSLWFSQTAATSSL